MRALPPILVLCLAAAPGALAHPADLVVARFGAGARPGELVERLTVTPWTLLRLAPLDLDGDGQLSPAELEAGGAAVAAGVWDGLPLSSPAGPCRRSGERATLAEGTVELEAAFRCPEGPLSQELELLRILPPNYRLELWGPGDEVPAFAQGPGRLPVRRPEGGWSWAAVLGGLEAGLARGLRLDSLAALGCLGLAIRRWRRAAAGVVALTLGLLVGVGAPWAPGAVGAAVALAAGGAALARWPGEPPVWAAAAAGAALGLLDGGGALSRSVGVAAGAAAVAALALPAWVAVGGLLRRRGAWAGRVRWAAAAGLAFSAGLRLAA